MARVTVSDWRAAADPDDLREYDRFGPWIDSIREPVDMPRRFRPWWAELSGARYLLKVPRSYDRAQVRPGMDLYESLLAVFPDSLCVLRAGRESVQRTDVSLGQVVATCRFANLLLSRWSLLLADGDRFDIEFNTVSRPVIDEVDRYLMARWPSDTPPHAPLPAVRPADHYFRSTLAELNATSDDPVVPVHVDEAGLACRTGRRGRRRTSGLMVLASTSHLLVVDRELAVKPRFGRANYATRTLAVPLDGITSFELVVPEPSDPPQFHELVLHCGRQRLVRPCLARPDGVVALLRELGVPLR